MLAAFAGFALDPAVGFLNSGALMLERPVFILRCNGTATKKSRNVILRFEDGRANLSKIGRAFFGIPSEGEAGADME